MRDALMTFARSWRQHDVTHLAAALAYYAVFSLPSMLLLVIAVGGFVIGDEAIRVEAYAAIDRYVGGSGADLLKSTVEGAILPGRSLPMTVVGVVGLLVGGTAIIREAQHALIRICGKRKAKPVSLASRFLRGFLAIPVVSALLLAAVASSVLLTLLSTQAAAYIDVTESSLSAANTLLSLGTLTVLIVALYALLIPRHMPFGALLGGAFFASLLLVVSKAIFGFYVGTAKLGAAYGVAASALVLLMWTYVAAIIFLTGAEIARHLAESARKA